MGHFCIKILKIWSLFLAKWLLFQGLGCKLLLAYFDITTQHTKFSLSFTLCFHSKGLPHKAKVLKYCMWESLSETNLCKPFVSNHISISVGSVACFTRFLSFHPVQVQPPRKWSNINVFFCSRPREVFFFFFFIRWRTLCICTGNITAYGYRCLKAVGKNPIEFHTPL